VTDVLRDLRGAWRPALQLHLFFRAAGFAVAAPLLTLAFRGLLATSGDRVISNYDIAAFLLSPTGAALAVAAAAISVALVLAELAGLTHIAGQQLRGGAATLGGTLATLGQRPAGGSRAGDARRAARCTDRAPVPARGRPRLARLARGARHQLLPRREAARVGADVVARGDPRHRLHAGDRLAAHTVALLRACARAATGLDRRESLAESARATRGQFFRVLRPLLAWWLAAAAVGLGLLLAGRSLSALVLGWAGMSMARVLPVVAISMTSAFAIELLLSGFTLAGQQFIVTRGYSRQAGLGTAPGADVASERGVGRLAMRALAAVLAIAAVAGVGAWIALSRLDLRPRVEVTAHRGASIAAPENTMAAFRAALNAGSDWIELDVQRMADGRVVVIHDGDFLRVGGDPRKVGAVTAADLAGSTSAPGTAQRSRANRRHCSRT
jgi:glycerophosphoryl diester phosphodiesterase